MRNTILISTVLEIHGYRIIEHRGMVRGLIVRSPTIAQGIMGGLKNLIGGKIGAYAEMCEQARDQACQEIEKHALEMGANAIIGFRYDATDIGGQGSAATEVLCYGTAVTVEKL
jgi:uncharacterized protein YbjQ (UPF0145 family)